MMMKYHIYPFVKISVLEIWNWI